MEIVLATIINIINIILIGATLFGLVVLVLGIFYALNP